MESQRAGSPEPGAPRPSEAEPRAIAAQLAGEHDQPPPASPGTPLAAQAHELAPAAEERVSDALVALGVIGPETSPRAEREAAAGPEPRPVSWGLDGVTPDATRHGTPDGPRDGARGGPDGD